MKSKILKLLTKYNDLRSDIILYNINYYDAIGYDIEGYKDYIDELDESDLARLENQVKAFECLIKCHKNINFNYC